MIKVFYSYNMVESDTFIKKTLNIFCGKELEIKFTKSGKPYVDYPIYFSLTHTDSLIACAVSDSEIGIDAEKIRPFRNKDSISKKFLGIDKKLDDTSFIKKWTEFESKVKYFGESIFDCPNAKTKNLVTKHIMIKDYVVSVSADAIEEIEMEMI